MNLGAEPKKIAILGGLLVAGGYVFYANVLAGPDTDTRKPRAPLGQAVAPATPFQARAVVSTHWRRIFRL